MKVLKHQQDKIEQDKTENKLSRFFVSISLLNFMNLKNDHLQMKDASKIDGEEWINTDGSLHIAKNWLHERKENDFLLIN